MNSISPSQSSYDIFTGLAEQGLINARANPNEAYKIANLLQHCSQTDIYQLLSFMGKETDKAMRLLIGLAKVNEVFTKELIDRIYREYPAGIISFFAEIRSLVRLDDQYIGNRSELCEFFHERR